MKDILTTAEAAKLLGISVRTAQLWVESGSIPSWKTPGGHRRIPRSAILPLMQGQSQVKPQTGAKAVVLTDAEHAEAWNALGRSGFVVDAVEDPLLAAIRVGEVLPSLIVIDDNGQDAHLQLLEQLKASDLLGHAVVVLRTDRPSLSTSRSVHLELQKSLPVPACIDAILAYVAQRSALPKVKAVTYPVAENEAERLRAVNRSGLLYTPREEAFDRLINLATRLFNAPLAMFTLLSSTQQWFKASAGYEEDATPREWSLCNYTLVANELTVLEDLTADPRVSNHITLNAPFSFRFYAGAPVRDEDGFALGSICIIDHAPRKFSQEDRDALLTLADSASQIIQFRSQTRAFRALRPKLAQKQGDAVASAH